MKRIKFSIATGLFILCASFTPAASLSELLQRGLFEEEANRNFEAAIKAYESAVSESEEQRKLVATAIFRLGECYRKLGKTNEAKAQYQRVLRDFSDQTTLANLSQQNLLVLGSDTPKVAAQPNAPATDEEGRELQRIRALVKDSPDLINARNSDGDAPIHNAADRGWLMVVQSLLTNRADANAPGKGKSTPLHRAAAAGHKKMVELLLANGAEVNAHNNNDETPLHMAVQRGYKSVVELLLAHKADVNAGDASGWTLLHFATLQGHKAISEVLLAKGADVNAASTTANDHALPGGRNLNAQVGVKPLHVAAGVDNQAMVEFLCSNGAEVNAKDKMGNTPLHVAIVHGAKSALQALLIKKGDLNSRKTDGNTPLHLAVRFGRKELLEILLTAGADPDIVAENGRTALHEALDGVLQSDFVPLLLAHRANPNATQKAGWTPLHFLVSRSKTSENTVVVELAKLLLAHKADVNLRTQIGLTTLNLLGVPAKANNKTQFDLIALLKEHGAIDDISELQPALNTIRAWRKPDTQGRLVFTKDSEGQNHFSLAETLFSFYSAQGGTILSWRPEKNDSAFDFPDFNRIKIHRLVDGKTYRRIEVNLLSATDGVDCAKDMTLEFGDVIEIPEREHRLGERATGLTDRHREELLECLKMRATLVVRGQSTELPLYPGRNRYLSILLRRSEALKVLVSSSDLSRVKVKRGGGGKDQEHMVDVAAFRTSGKPESEDLLLLDGDVIEVPDKATGASATTSSFEIRLVRERPDADTEPMTRTLKPEGASQPNEKVLHVEKTSLLDGSAIASATIQTNRADGGLEIKVAFTEAGARRFAEITRQNVGKQLAILIDGKVATAPFLRAEISDGHAIVSGNLSEKAARELAAKLNDAIER